MNKNGILSVVIVVLAVLLIGLWVFRTGQQRAGARQFDCADAPTAPVEFVVAKTATQVRASWKPPTSAEAPTTYVLESGSATGQNDVATLVTPASQTTFERDLVPGTFYVRVYARNACGTSQASNEVVITVP